MRIREICVDNVINIGAVPFVAIQSIYVVINQYLQSGPTPPTFSSDTIAAPGPYNLLVGTTTGMTQGAKLMLDTDQQREECTIRFLPDATHVSIIARRAHSGTYPVQLTDGLVLARGLISDFAALDINTQDSYLTAGIAKVDEVEFFK